MSAGSLIARKSIRARWGRTLAIAFAITASVSFVVGSFVLADSLRATFDSLFQELNENVDLEVRSDAGIHERRRPRPDRRRHRRHDSRRRGRRHRRTDPATGSPSSSTRDGEAITPAGGPSFGVSWEGEDGLQGVDHQGGSSPDGPDEVAIDKATADAEDFAIGDTISYLTDVGTFEGTITATVGLGSGDSFGGAQITALDLDTALVHFGADGKVDAIDIQLVDGADVADGPARDCRGAPTADRGDHR